MVILSNQFDLGQVKNIVRTLAAAEDEAVAAAEAEEQRRQEARPQQVLEAPAQGPRAPRTLLLPQEMSIDERPHCKCFVFIYRKAFVFGNICLATRLCNDP